MGLDRIRLIKEKIGVLEYAQSVLNLPVRKSGDRCASLVPGSMNPMALVLLNFSQLVDFNALSSIFKTLSQGDFPT